MKIELELSIITTSTKYEPQPAVHPGGMAKWLALLPEARKKFEC